MTDDNQFYNELFAGLTALAKASFPKRCANCGRVFETAEQFLHETEDIQGARSPLKQSQDEDGSNIVEAFRNCPCGSTLMDVFSDRRDVSEAGIARRKKFEELLVFLCENGVEGQLAHAELLKVMRGEKSSLLATIRPPGK